MNAVVDIATFDRAYADGLGTQDVLANLGGLTPKGALFFNTSTWSGSNPSPDAFLGVGAATAATGANQWATFENAFDAVGTTDVNSAGVDGICVGGYAPAGNNFDAELNSWIADGARLDWIRRHSNLEVHGSALFFAGSSVECHANTFSLGGQGAGTTISVTDPGFTPDIVFFGSAGTAIDVHQHYRLLSFGVAANKTGIPQFTQVISEADGSSTSGAYYHLSDVYCCYPSSTQIELTSWLANGFEVTVRGNGGSTDGIGYLAVKGVSVDTQMRQTRTTLGQQSNTGAGFQPDVLLTVGTMMDSLNTTVQNDDGGGTSYAMASTSRARAVQDISDVGASTTDEESEYTAKALHKRQQYHGTYHADLLSFDGDGYTLDYTAVAFGTRYFFDIALAGSEGLPQTLTGTSVLDAVGFGSDGLLDPAPLILPNASSINALIISATGAGLPASAADLSGSVIPEAWIASGGTIGTGPILVPGSAISDLWGSSAGTLDAAYLLLGSALGAPFATADGALNPAGAATLQGSEVTDPWSILAGEAATSALILAAAPISTPWTLGESDLKPGPITVPGAAIAELWAVLPGGIIRPIGEMILDAEQPRSLTLGSDLARHLNLNAELL